MRVLDPVALPGGRVWRGRFDRLTRWMHWTTVLLVLFQLASGWSFALVEGTPLHAPLLFAHRSSGVAVWAITAFRWGWRASFARFPPFPAALPHLMRWVAKKSEQALYVLLLFEPLTGLADTLLRGRPFDVFIWSIPAMLPRHLDWSLFFRALHEWGAWALAGLAGVHALAALFHHVILRDDVLESMLPWVARDRS
jgi:cytochrome b561